MSQSIIQPSDCCNPCADPIVQNIPGTQGIPGVDGADGSNGVNAFTITTAAFTVPAVAGDVSIAVANSSWMTPTQVIYIQNAGYYTLISKASTNEVTARNLGYTGNAAPAVVVALLQLVGPGGIKGTDGVAVGVTLDSISPTTTKGDFIVDNGANNPAASTIRLAAPTNTYVWTADTTQASGWLAKDPKITATASLNFAAFAGFDSQDLTIALIGAVAGDPVSLGCPAAIPALLVPFAFVSAPDVVTVRLTAVAAVADPAAMDYTVRINKL